MSFIVGSVTSFVKSSFLNSLGDVARYLTPEPDNIAERNNIRQQGITFLKKLHELNNRSKPDRIIVVAHSLGTVVAYDLLRLLWTDYNEIYTKAPTGKQPLLDVVDGFAKAPSTIAANSDVFAQAQYQCWEEAQTLGNPWLITDFITVGAALNAIDYFMVSHVPTAKLIEERELPVCPPELDSKDQSIYYRGHIEKTGAKRRPGVNVLNHGAMFGMTRWANIYFSSDFVGGSMQRVFGKGVKDLVVKRKSAWFYPGGHTHYWDTKDKDNALREIVEAMKL